MNNDEFIAISLLQTEYLMTCDDHISDCLCDNCIIMKTLTRLYHDNKWRFQ